MKVYAHYFKDEESKNDYRWRTLLQFGTSWNIIGSVVMKNPGSAVPLKQVEEGCLLNNLNGFCKEYEWFEFSVDNTMRCIESLFRSYYQHNVSDSELNGVIQIFNLMNVRDPDLNQAIIRNKKSFYAFSVTIDKDIVNMVPPIYLGWGKLGFSSMFADNARLVFEKTIEKFDGQYLNAKFENNLFYHPQYLMGRGKNKSQSRQLLNAFCQNSQSSE
jgi:hypothetical protein